MYKDLSFEFQIYDKKKRWKVGHYKGSFDIKDLKITCNVSKRNDLIMKLEGNEIEAHELKDGSL